MRVLGLTLIVDALYAIQITRLTAEVNFKTQAKVTAVKILVGGVTGIAFAYNGFGPWSLVAYNMTSGITSIVLYYSITKWHPKLIFSKKAFSELFGFGVKLLAANLLHTVYTNISTLIIGRKYTSQDLGFYSRGDSFSGLPIGIYTSTFSRVIYPVLAKVQDDENELRRVYAKYLRLIAAIVVPSMLLFAGCMTPFIRVLIGDQWIPAANFAMLLCFAQMFDPLTRVNSNILYVKGRSDILLKLEFIKKAIGISTVMIAVQFGVVWLCVGRVLYSIVAFVLNASFGGRFLGMSVFRQVKEVLPSYVIGGAVFALAYFVTSLVSNKYISILTGGFSGLVLFVVLICLFKLELWTEITQRTVWLFNRIGKRRT
jgi:O-antigen/teichoic acid export membrane protein